MNAGWQPGSIEASVLSTIGFSFLGLILSIVAYKVFDLATPLDFTKELGEKQNVAVGLMVGAIILGSCLIVAAAIL